MIVKRCHGRKWVGLDAWAAHLCLPFKEGSIQEVEELVEKEQLFDKDTIALLPITAQGYVDTPIKLPKAKGEGRERGGERGNGIGRESGRARGGRG